MTSPFRILCAVDASLPAAPAFEQALATSASRGAQLAVVHAVPQGRGYSWGAAERVTALAALRERAEALKVPVRVRTQQGETASVVLLHARAQAPDLIVLGSHQPVGLARFRFGAVADRVVAGAACPVLLVPVTIAHAAPSFHKVVCAVDLSPRSPAMIRDVSRFIEGGGQLTLLHVLHHSAWSRPGRLAVPELARAAAHDARQQLDSMLAAANVVADVIVTSSASVDDEILRVASETAADLVVVGVTRRAGLRRRLLGSTAIRVSRRSSIPVLILPAVHVKRTLSTLDQAALGWAA